MRLITLIIGTLLMFFMVFMAARMWGENQSFRPFDAPFLKIENSPVLIVGWEQNFLLEKKSDLILWADVYRAQDENLLVKPWADRNKAKQDLEQTANPARPLLKDLLNQFPNTKFVINCDDNVQDIQKQLVQVINETKSIDRIMLQSNFNTILTTAKIMLPMLVFGSTIADITRLKTFESMWMLPSASFSGDVFFAPLKYRDRNALSRDIVLEMKRRFKKVFIGPLKTPEEVAEARAYEPDGLFVEDPLLVLEK
ncbi:MAG: hypothetical protein ACXWC9_02690 [Pseudobdellovibrionaceae bacterium]